MKNVAGRRQLGKVTEYGTGSLDVILTTNGLLTTLGPRAIWALLVT